MSFWDIVWFIFISFAFIAYLMVLFMIITDLFRDRETSGVAKAIWIVALIFLPLLTSLVYLIARGPGMAERSEEQAKAAKQRSDEYIREVTSAEPRRHDCQGEGTARSRHHHGRGVPDDQDQGSGLGRRASGATRPVGSGE